MLFTIVNKKEIRILYTQNFTPGVFDECFTANASQKKLDAKERKLLFINMKEKYSG
jgi:hypothetical protein